ncbi:MAG: hypothetical protein AAF434_20365 [Pseudomonadota bacterium]
MIIRPTARIAASLSLILAGFTPAHADRGLDVGVGVNVGTLGAGINATFNINDYFNARLGYNSLSLDEEQTEDDIDYDVEFDLKTTELMLDWYPFSGSFRTTIGYIANGSDVSGSASITDATEVGSVTVTEGSLTSDLDFDSSAYYFGVGWGNPMGDSEGFSFVSDIGVIALGEPTFSITGVTVVSSVGNVEVTQEDIDEQEADTQEDIDDVLWPVARIGVVYRF